MNTEEILAKLKNIIHEHLGSEVDNVGMDTKLSEDLQADSLDKVDMVMSAEDEFSIEIDDEAAIGFITVGDVVNYISTKL